MNRPFEVLKQYYGDVDTRESGPGGPYKRTAVGQFVPSPLRHIHAAIEHLLRAGAIDAAGPLLDAGCGDARFVALTALVHHIPTVGIEYDEELVERSKRHLGALERLGLHGAPMTIVPGDFNDDASYLKAGMRFEDFTIVYNYINNERHVAEKVARQSRPGTKFLLLGAFPLPTYGGLTLEHNLELITRTDVVEGVAVENLPLREDSNISPDATYLQVYLRE